MSTLKLSKVAPLVTSNFKNAVEGFAGGGGVAIALHEMGYCSKVAIEKNPEERRQPLYKKIADCYENNFGQHTILHRMLVEEWADTLYRDCPEIVHLAHFSPSCCNFSNKGRKTETQADIKAARAIGSFISDCMPQKFILEEVNNYQDSESIVLILKSLNANGYSYTKGLIDFNQLGVPQTRKRFMVIASRTGSVCLPEKHNSPTWYEFIGDMIEDLPELDLLPVQEEAIANYQGFNDDTAYLIPRTGFYGKYPKIYPQDKPAPTIVSSIFTDHKNSNRNRFWNIVYKGKSYQVTIDCIRKLCTFPDWYKMPKEVAIAGSILGNAIPPLAYMHILNDCFWDL